MPAETHAWLSFFFFALQARPSLAPIFFTLYVTMVALIMLNLFIGIISAYFNSVHMEIKQRDFWKKSALSWEGERTMQLRVLHLCVSVGCLPVAIFIAAVLLPGKAATSLHVVVLGGVRCVCVCVCVSGGFV